MVLRSIPVTRSISRWLVPFLSSVCRVIRKCNFKTFNSGRSLEMEQRKRPVASPPAHPRRRHQLQFRWGILGWPRVGDFGWPPGVSWLGSQADRKELAKRVSPINYVRAGLPPILTIHGNGD